MRELSLEEFVDEIYEDFCINKDTEYVFFLGAGCSKSSGIPLASELAEEWYAELKKQKSKFDRFNKENQIDVNKGIDYAKYYFKIFEALFPTPLAQQKKIQSITEGKIPSLGYYMLSALMQEPQFNAVVTTNFDNLIQDALIYSGEKRALVITHQDLAKFIKRDNTPLITKIHGDAHMHPFNNEGNTEEIPKELKSAIQGLFINAKVICIGYGGNDKSIANLLDGCNRIDQVYWLNSSEPNDVAVKDWWNITTNKTYIEEYDFDKIMNLMKSKFNLPKPDFNKRAKALQDSYHNAIKEEITEIEEVEDKTFLDYFILGSNYYAEEDYVKAIEAYKEAIKLNPKNSAANGNIALAYENLKNYDEAEEYYLIALEMEPNSVGFNGNYALFLQNIKQDYDSAEKYYLKALELESNSANLSSAYAVFLNNIKEDYEEAEKYYLKALELEPLHAGFNGNYAIFLKDIKEDYDEAQKYYLKALEIEPNNAHNNGNYAGFLLSQNKKDEARKYLDNAFKFSSNNRGLETELYFYKLAHFKDEYFESKEKLDELLKDGHKSPYWNFSSNIKQAIKDKHEHIDELKEYAKKISSIDYSKIK